MIDKEMMHQFYLESKKMKLHDFLELSSAASSEEEAVFYMKVSEYFLQIAQREVIRKGLF